MLGDNLKMIGVNSTCDRLFVNFEIIDGNDVVGVVFAESIDLNLLLEVDISNIERILLCVDVGEMANID